MNHINHLFMSTDFGKNFSQYITPIRGVLQKQHFTCFLSIFATVIKPSWLAECVQAPSLLNRNLCGFKSIWGGKLIANVRNHKPFEPGIGDWVLFSQCISLRASMLDMQERTGQYYITGIPPEAQIKTNKQTKDITLKWKASKSLDLTKCLPQEEGFL